MPSGARSSVQSSTQSPSSRSTDCFPGALGELDHHAGAVPELPLGGGDQPEHDAAVVPRPLEGGLPCLATVVDLDAVQLVLGAPVALLDREVGGIGLGLVGRAGASDQARSRGMVAEHLAVGGLEERGDLTLLAVLGDLGVVGQLLPCPEPETHDCPKGGVGWVRSQRRLQKLGKLERGSGLLPHDQFHEVRRLREWWHAGGTGVVPKAAGPPATRFHRIDAAPQPVHVVVTDADLEVVRILRTHSDLERVTGKPGRERTECVDRQRAQMVQDDLHHRVGVAVELDASLLAPDRREVVHRADSQS